jgi:2-polyprenyl-6-methoxyphenol hydroxylase-like FAD-dependent oxidoreductase
LDRPADAIPVFQREILRTLAGGKRAAYRDGAELAKELRDYAERADQSEEFSTWIRTVRKDNSRRSALQDDFNAARLPR